MLTHHARPACHPPLRGVRAATARRKVSSMAARDDAKVGVLFVCLGNICRSPTAEAVFVDVVKKAGLSEQYTIDSCGTGGGSPDWYLPGGFSYHEGDDADPRMTAAASKRGVVLTSKSRPLQPDDFSKFRYIVGRLANTSMFMRKHHGLHLDYGSAAVLPNMEPNGGCLFAVDPANMEAIKKAADFWKKNGNGDRIPDNYEGLLYSMAHFCEAHKVKAVPDPYFGGSAGFDKVLDLLDDACTGLLTKTEGDRN